jgi:DNA end-binding protein Ku
LPEKNREPAAAVRAFWSGTITFGLVSIPVNLFSAARSRKTAMKMVDAKGRALGRQYYCPKHERKLSNDEIVRGFEMENGKTVVVTDEELEAVAPDKTRDIELRSFVPAEQIPPMYFQRPYFLAPSGKSTKAYHLLAETMERTRRVGIGSFVMRDHEYLVAILSENGVLRAETLRFADELRTPEDVGLPKRKKAAANKVKALSKEITALTRDELDPRELADQYAAAIEELVERKQKTGKDVVHITGAEDEDAEPGMSNVIDLLAVLRRSLSAKATVTTADKSKQASAPGRASSHSARKRASGKNAARKRSTTRRKAAKSRAGRKRVTA